jgi:pyruvate dehydrogenase E1 component alpha subunit
VTQRRDNLDAARVLEHYRMMVRIRAFEEAAGRAQHDGHVTGAIHQSIGQEAIPTGVCANLGPADMIVSNHRGHGHTLAKGADAGAMMRELFGKAGGTCGGKGGSMHIADFAIGMLGANGVVAAGIPIAVGAAHATRIRGGREIVVCFFGDGAINRGPFLEGLNWAAVYSLPVLFVCEDNGYAAMTDTAEVSAGLGPGARAESLGVAARKIDGNDVVVVDDAARELIGQVRSQGEPRLLWAKTYRLAGHTTVDPDGYRRAEDIAAHREREPIGRCRVLLSRLGLADRDLDRIAVEARQEMNRAVADGIAAPWPDAAQAYSDVQDIGAP